MTVLTEKGGLGLQGRHFGKRKRAERAETDGKGRRKEAKRAVKNVKTD